MTTPLPVRGRPPGEHGGDRVSPLALVKTSEVSEDDHPNYEDQLDETSEPHEVGEPDNDEPDEKAFRHGPDQSGEDDQGDQHDDNDEPSNTPNYANSQEDNQPSGSAVSDDSDEDEDLASDYSRDSEISEASATATAMELVANLMASQSTDDPIHEADLPELERYVEVTLDSVGWHHYIVLGPTVYRPGRILLRHWSDKASTYKLWGLGQQGKEPDPPPMVRDIIVDDIPENIRLFVHAYFIIMARKYDLRKVWTAAACQQRGIPTTDIWNHEEPHDAVSNRLLEKIGRYLAKHPSDGRCLQTISLGRGRKALKSLRKSEGSLMLRRLVLARGQDESKEYLDAYDGWRVSLGPTDVVLPENEDTLDVLWNTVRQKLRHMTLDDEDPDHLPAEEELPEEKKKKRGRTRGDSSEPPSRRQRQT